MFSGGNREEDGLELRNIKSPEDIRNLSVSELESLAQEIRSTIIGTVSKTGGHLAASLGTVELTLALHSVLIRPGTRSCGMWGTRPTLTN